VAARAGIDVVLLDTQEALAERGKAHARQGLARSRLSLGAWAAEARRHSPRGLD